MAIERTVYSINLDISQPNNRFQKHFLQGSNDSDFKISILKNGVEQIVDNTTKVKVVVMYGVNASGCGTITSNKGQYVLSDTDTDYSQKVNISEGKISVKLDENFTNSSGENALFIMLNNGIVANTYSMFYTVDINPAYQQQSIPDNLPTFKSIINDVSIIKSQQQTNNQNTQNIVNNFQNLNNSITTLYNAINDLKSKLEDIKLKINENEENISAAAEEINNNKTFIDKLKSELVFTPEAIANKAYIKVAWNSAQSKPIITPEIITNP